MATKKVLTVFGATGNQGGSVIDVILSESTLREKYVIRGITRHTSNPSAQALTARGVEMFSANVNDVNSLRQAIRGSHSVFGLTNFWDKDVLSKEIEIQQGKNIFEACQAERVIHYVYSTLPYATKLTDGELQHIEHFDGKAMVAEYIESQKGDMIVSYFMPAMYIKSYKDQISPSDGSLTIFMPTRQNYHQPVAWPILDARRDSGKFIVGLLEGGPSSNGVRVHGVSTWTTPQALLEAIEKVLPGQKKIAYAEVAPEVMLESLPTEFAREITETMRLVQDYSYYGPGEEGKQHVHDRWLYGGQETLGLEALVQGGGPWQF